MLASAAQLLSGQNLVLALVYGGIYGLLAVGIVLVYRGSRVLNFAQGEVGTLGLFMAWFLTTKHHLPWLVGAAGAVIVAAAVGLGFERFIVRRMVDAGRLAVAVATVGLLLFLLAVEFRGYGASPYAVPGPIGGTGFRLAGVVVSPTQVIALLVTGAVAVSLNVVLRRTDFGLGVLAAADDPTAVRLVGIRLSRVSAFTWGAGAAISALAVLLIEPTVGVFAPGFASELFVKGLAAALVGGLSSLEGAFLGGLVVGFVEIEVKSVTLGSRFPGIPTLAIFGLIILMLLARPRGLLGSAVRT